MKQIGNPIRLQNGDDLVVRSGENDDLYIIIENARYTRPSSARLLVDDVIELMGRLEEWLREPKGSQASWSAQRWADLTERRS